MSFEFEKQYGLLDINLQKAPNPEGYCGKFIPKVGNKNF